jgi:hypothetical protein
MLAWLGPLARIHAPLALVIFFSTVKMSLARAERVPALGPDWSGIAVHRQFALMTTHLPPSKKNSSRLTGDPPSYI